MTTNTPTPLGPESLYTREGQQRRDEAFAAVLEVAGRRRRRRVVVRASAIALPLLGLAIGLVVFARWNEPAIRKGTEAVAVRPDQPNSRETTPVAVVAHNPVPPQQVAIQVVSTQDCSGGRIARTADFQPEKAIVGDAELLEILQKSGCEAGIIRVGDRVSLSGAKVEQPRPAAPSETPEDEPESRGAGPAATSV